MSAAEKSGRAGRTGGLRSRSAEPATGPAIVGARESDRSRDASAGVARRKTTRQQTITSNRAGRFVMP